MKEDFLEKVFSLDDDIWSLCEKIDKANAFLLSPNLDQWKTDLQKMRHKLDEIYLSGKSNEIS